ncbi:MAG: hypothetical protein SF182_17045 [Deltaproteobacteria bacterium]|nr:hypothetical protein [Deltaproteobacteria bacterium]
MKRTEVIGITHYMTRVCVVGLIMPRNPERRRRTIWQQANVSDDIFDESAAHHGVMHRLMGKKRYAAPTVSRQKAERNGQPPRQVEIQYENRQCDNDRKMYRKPGQPHGAPLKNLRRQLCSELPRVFVHCGKARA